MARTTQRRAQSVMVTRTATVDAAELRERIRCLQRRMAAARAHAVAVCADAAATLERVRRACRSRAPRSMESGKWRPQRVSPFTAIGRYGRPTLPRSNRPPRP
jgi:hypothetical protein